MASTMMRAQRQRGGNSGQPRKRFTRAAFYIHLWLGDLATIALIAISITGILLNHKRGLGLMPEVPYEPTASFAEAISLERMAAAALEAAPESAKPGWKSGDPVAIGLIDRMDVRPRDGFVKVRLRDKASMEMTVDIATGRVVHVGRRGDVFLEKLHSGEAFGGGMVILSDIAAVFLVLTLITGYWLWLAPKLNRGRQAEPVDRS
jgi:hypothetical protein